MAVLGVSSWAADSLADGGIAPASATDTDNYSSAGHAYDSLLGQFARVAIPPTADFWVAHRHWTNSTGSVYECSGGDTFRLYDANDNIVAAVGTTTAEIISLWVRISGTLTSVAVTATATYLPASPYRMDLHADISVSGSITLYINGVELLTYSGDLTDGGSYGPIVSIDYRGRYSINGQDKSILWCLATDDDSRVYDCEQIIVNGVGAHSDFSGDYTAVDEVRTATPYTDVISSNTVGHKFSASTVDPLAAYATGYDVVGVQVTNRARAGNGNPRIKPLIRHGGVDATGNAALLNGTDSAAKHLFTVNPSTGVAFTHAELASIEIGCEIAAAV